MPGLKGPIGAFPVDLEQALEELQIPLYLCDSGGVFRWINRHTRDLVGDIVGRKLASVAAPEALDESLRQFARKTDGAVATSYELTLLNPAGLRMMVQIHSVPVHAGDRVVGVFGAAIPIGPLQDPATEWRRPELTPRQRQVLALLAAGRSTPEIAARLGIARETTRNHVRAVLNELGVHSRLAAVAEAQRHGLV